MRHAGKWFPQFVVGLIVFVIFINVVGASVEPYMPMIGKTFAFLLIVLGIAVVGFIVFLVVRIVLNNIGGGGDEM